MGKGLGRMLFKRLVQPAQERGVREFEVLIVAVAVPLILWVWPL